MMKYERTFNLQIAHFNNARAYEYYAKALELLNASFLEKDPEIYRVHAQNLVQCCSMTHGHNLKIGIELGGSMIKPEGWNGSGMLVDDAELEKMVMAWDNVNLSTLSEFAESNRRATTEEIAQVLCEKIFNQWENLDWVNVSVEETPLIKATAYSGIRLPKKEKKKEEKKT